MNLTLTSFLLENGGPILSWRTATELMPPDSGIDRQGLLADLLDCAEVRRWLNLLGKGPVHHSVESSVENALAKLCEYGLRAGMQNLDARISPYCAISEGGLFHSEAIILAPFLVRAGYANDARVAGWIADRIERLYELACRKDYEFYMDEAQRKSLPPSQQMLHGEPKRFYQPSFKDHWNLLCLPTCYDLFALAYLPKEDLATNQKIETIVAYLLQPEFQATPGGYIWNSKLHRAYAAGRVFLACLPGANEREKLVLFLEILAQFACGRASEWFREGMAHLETFRREDGTYKFPNSYLSEKSGYYLYSGKHMGLGEQPRNERALVLESTFRMARLLAVCSKIHSHGPFRPFAT